MKAILLFLVLCHSMDSHSKQLVACEGSKFEVAQLESLRASLLNMDFKPLANAAAFPITVQFDSSLEKADEIILGLYLEDIMSPKRRGLIKLSTLCEIVKFLGIESQDDGSIKFTKMVFDYDEEDAKYSHSSISSVKTFHNLIKDINCRLNNGSTDHIGRYLKYPFLINSPFGDLTIKNIDEFLEHKNEVLNDSFRSIMRNALNNDNLKFMPTGVMLNARGDIWIQEYVDVGLRVVILNKKSSRE
jgi:hypothetical protein